MEQSQLLCEHLANQFDIKTILVSPAIRTLETIAPLKIQSTIFIEENAIREIDCGEWESKF